jgi:hypothetical protein
LNELTPEEAAERARAHLSRSIEIRLLEPRPTEI